MKKILTLLLILVSIMAVACTPKEKELFPEGYVTPVVRIITENNAPVVSKEDYVDCTVVLEDAKGVTALDGVEAGVRGRGNHTWTLDKKGYRIKFDKKQAMLSDYKCKSWALLPNYTDKTLFRNYLAFRMANQMDGIEWSTDAKIIELYLNNEYLGVYLLCDQTEVDENRVDVTISETDSVTGFLVERDHYSISDPSMVKGRDYFTIEGDVLSYTGNPKDNFELPYVIKEPEYPDKDDYDTEEAFNAAESLYMEQFEYIKNYVTGVYQAIKAHDLNELEKFVELESFVDYAMIDEVLSNYESNRVSSFYMHKDINSKLRLGPCWDYDSTVGFVPYAQNPNHHFRNECKFFNELGSCSKYMNMYRDNFNKYEEMIVKEVDNLTKAYTANKAAIDRNNDRWPISVYVYPMTETMSSMTTYKEHLNYLQNWVKGRCDYLSEYLNKSTNFVFNW